MNWGVQTPKPPTIQSLGVYSRGRFRPAENVGTYSTNTQLWGMILVPH